VQSQLCSGLDIVSVDGSATSPTACIQQVLCSSKSNCLGVLKTVSLSGCDTSSTACIKQGSSSAKSTAFGPRHYPCGWVRCLINRQHKAYTTWFQSCLFLGIDIDIVCVRSCWLDGGSLPLSTPVAQLACIQQHTNTCSVHQLKFEQCTTCPERGMDATAAPQHLLQDLPHAFDQNKTAVMPSIRCHSGGGDMPCIKCNMRKMALTQSSQGNFKVPLALCRKGKNATASPRLPPRLSSFEHP